MRPTPTMLLLCGLAASAAAAPDIEVIYASVPGSPQAQVPGRSGLVFRSPTVSMLTLGHSPDGRHWIFKGFADDGLGNTIDVIVAGSGTLGATVADETETSPDPLYGYSFFDSDVGINDAGQFAIGARLDGPDAGRDEVIITGPGLAIAVREGDPAPELADPLGVAGDETFGNSLNSAHRLADGRVAFRADLIQGLADSAFESALYIAGNVVSQEGIDFDGFSALPGNTFASSADGSTWIVEADDDPDIFGTTEAVVVNNAPQIREGDLLDGSVVDAVFAVNITGGGTWFARGDWTDGDDWAVRDGALLARTGDPLPDGLDNIGDAIGVATGDDDGNTLVVCSTDNPDPGIAKAMIYNGTDVLCRIGDPVDLDGNGSFDDDTVLRDIDPADAFISADGHVYFFCTLRNESGTNLGSAFVRVPLPVDCGPADLNGDGLLDFFDVSAFLAAFNAGDPVADFNGDTLFDFFDVSAFLALFNAGCG